MKNNSFKHHFRILLITAALLGTLFCLWLLATDRYHAYLMSNEQAHTLTGASYYGNSLATAVNRRFALLDGLMAFVQAETASPDGFTQKEFDTFAAGLYAGTKGVRNFGIAPDGIMKYLFPLAGNEKALGHNLIQHERPEVREDVQRTIRTGKTALSGPYELRQGGLGLIARSAVYHDKKFWGLATVALDMEPLFSMAGLDKESNLKLSVRKQSGEVFYGDPELFKANPVIYRVALPEGAWEVAAIPSAGWGSSIKTEYVLFKTSGVTIICLVATIFYLLSRQSMHLSLAVKKRTEQLENEVAERKKIAEDLRRSEQQLIQAQKMEAVGQLAGGIAHDFNNILSAIIGYTHLIKMKIREDDPIMKSIERILSSSERAAQLVRSLLSFSRKQIINMEPMDLNEVINKIEKLLHRIIGEDIVIKTLLSEEKIIVSADSGQIEQAIMNLATNARDAMPGSGTLTLKTGRVKITGSFIKSNGFGKLGEYAVITINDTGSGMNEDTRKRIFEPFFTTKEVGKGTGLGLSMVYGIIKQHEGYVVCESKPGIGTTFSIYLPLFEQTLIGAVPKAVAPNVYEGSGETILLAEDDETVRKLTVTTLEKFGYKVLAAKDGQDAIARFTENREDIRLLLFDVIMPVKNGVEAYEEIRRMRQDIKVLFLSGYTSDVIGKKGLLKEEYEIIFKPVSPENLLRKVREILDK